MQMIRLTHGHGDFADSVPSWIVFTEKFSSVMMLIWCLAGTAICYIRIIQVDEHAQGLPVDRRDSGWPEWLRKVYAPSVKTVLQAVHMFSGAGLFCSVLLLCVAMFGTGGRVTTCDVCLVITACVFALPHAAVAAQLILSSSASKSSMPLGVVELSMAAEAAILGPQLCVLWATADIYGRSALHQRGLYVLTTLAYAATVGACAWAPPRGSGDAQPPALAALGASVAASCASTVTLVVSFPNLRDWLFWLVIGLVMVVCIAMSFWDFREPFLEIMEPVMPLQTGNDKRLRRPWRDRLGNVLQVLVFASSASGVWNVYSEFIRPHYPSPYYDGSPGYSEDFGSEYVSTYPHHYDDQAYPVEQAPRFAHAAAEGGMDEETMELSPHDVPGAEHDMDHHAYGLTEYGSESGWLMARWREDADVARGGGSGVHVDGLISSIASAMGSQPSDIITEHTLHEHRVLLFRPLDPHKIGDDGLAAPPHVRWKKALHEAGDNGLEAVVDAAFPPELGEELCRRLSESQGLDDGEADVLKEPAARSACAAACEAWQASAHQRGHGN